jgi:hypothetical protein
MVVIPEKREINEMSLMTGPDYCLERISRLQCREEQPTQNPEN